MGHFIGFLLFITVPALGFMGKPWAWVFAAALAGLVGYWMMRPLAFSRFKQESIARGSAWPITTYVAGIYVSQLFVCTLLFLAGRGLGRLFSA